MEIKFFKYSGNGNDFIVIDNRKNQLLASNHSLWQKICQRKTGIGADGVLLLEEDPHFDYKMIYINSDGTLASMCGNGARCLAHFYHHIILTPDNKKNQRTYHFKTQNSDYQVFVDGEKIQLKMAEIYDIEKYSLDSISELKEFPNKFYINSGVPHLVIFVKNIDEFEVFKMGKKLRHHPLFFSEGGVNVNFVEIQSDGHLKIRTYERGVEDETLACGTGSVASAIFYQRLTQYSSTIKLSSLGGPLYVEISPNLDQVLFSGTVEHVFNGSFQC